MKSRFRRLHRFPDRATSLMGAGGLHVADAERRRMGDKDRTLGAGLEQLYGLGLFEPLVPGLLPAGISKPRPKKGIPWMLTPSP